MGKRRLWRALDREGEALSPPQSSDLVKGVMDDLGSMSAKTETHGAIRVREMATLIVAYPGPLWDGVEALLASVPRVGVIGKVESIEGAMRKAAAHRVDMLLVDGSFPEEGIRRLLGRCATTGGGVRTIVFANTARQARRVRRLSVDAVFTTGRPAGQLVSVVEDLLSRG